MSPLTAERLAELAHIARTTPDELPDAKSPRGSYVRTPGVSSKPEDSKVRISPVKGHPNDFRTKLGCKVMRDWHKSALPKFPKGFERVSAKLVDNNRLLMLCPTEKKELRRASHKIDQKAEHRQAAFTMTWGAIRRKPILEEKELLYHIHDEFLYVELEPMEMIDA